MTFESVMLNDEIAKRLKLTKQQNGFKSARDFANKFKSHQSTYTQHESGCSSISTDYLLYYSKLLDISPRLFFNNSYRETLP